MSIDVNVQNDLVIVTESSEDIVVNVSNAQGPAGAAGANGVGVPVGGATGQVLKKFTNTNFDTYWAADASGLTSVGLSMPSAFAVSNSPITSNGTIAVTGAGTASQYVRGDGVLADFPTTGGGGSSVSYYLNGSVNQGTFVGNVYYEMNKTPILGVGTDFTINADGYIAQFITDANDPDLLKIPGGNWNFELYFSASSGGGNPRFYVELSKYNGTIFTAIASGSTNPEQISFGTSISSYHTTLAVPETALLATDRLAVRVYVIHSGRTITFHTEDNHLSEIVTTFSTGLNALNGLTDQVQYFATGTSGTDFAISSATDTHTFNLPTASATNRGALSSADWTTFNNKQNALGFTPVPTTRTITINGTTLDLSADRTYTVSGSGDTIYTANGTLAGDRIVTSNGNSLTILGGKEILATIQTALELKTSATNKIVNLRLTNTSASGKTYALSSEIDGTFRIGDTTQTAFVRNSSGQVAINNGAPVGNALNTLVGYTNNTGILKITGASGSVDGNGLELFFTGNTSYANSLDRSGTIWRNLEISALSTTFRSSGSTSMTLTAAGRLLLGLTAESTFLLDVNGTARFSGTITAGTINAGAVTGSTALFTGNAAFGTTRIAIGGNGGFGGGANYWMEIVSNSFTINGNSSIEFIGGASPSMSYSGTINALSRINPTMNFSGGLTAYYNQYTSILNATGNASANTMYIRGYFVNSGTLTPNSTTIIPIGFENVSGSNLFNSTSGSTLFGGQFGGLNASAKVQIDSTTQGFLPPRMTNAQRVAIASPAVGLIVYCTDMVEGLYVNKSTGWTFII